MCYDYGRYTDIRDEMMHMLHMMLFACRMIDVYEALE